MRQKPLQKEESALVMALTSHHIITFFKVPVTYCNAVTNPLKPCGTFTWQQPDAILFVKLVTALPLMCYNMLPCVNSLSSAVYLLENINSIVI